MAYLTPIFGCGCGQVFGLDLLEGNDFAVNCSGCGTKVYIQVLIPKDLLEGDPSRPGRQHGKAPTKIS